MRSPKLLQVDGGWNKIVWMPKVMKERLADYIPKDVIDKIAIEDDVSSIDELKEFLKSKDHPVVEGWKELTFEEEVPEEEISIETTSPAIGVPIAGGGFKIILKDAKIHAKKIIIRTPKKK